SEITFDVQFNQWVFRPMAALQTKRIVSGFTADSALVHLDKSVLNNCTHGLTNLSIGDCPLIDNGTHLHRLLPTVGLLSACRMRRSGNHMLATLSASVQLPSNAGQFLISLPFSWTLPAGISANLPLTEQTRDSRASPTSASSAASAALDKFPFRLTVSQLLLDGHSRAIELQSTRLEYLYSGELIHCELIVRGCGQPVPLVSDGCTRSGALWLGPGVAVPLLRLPSSLPSRVCSGSGTRMAVVACRLAVCRLAEPELAGLTSDEAVAMGMRRCRPQGEACGEAAGRIAARNQSRLVLSRNLPLLSLETEALPLSTLFAGANASVVNHANKHQAATDAPPAVAAEVISSTHATMLAASMTAAQPTAEPRPGTETPRLSQSAAAKPDRPAYQLIGAERHQTQTGARHRQLSGGRRQTRSRCRFRRCGEILAADQRRLMAVGAADEPQVAGAQRGHGGAAPRTGERQRLRLRRLSVSSSEEDPRPSIRSDVTGLASQRLTRGSHTSRLARQPPLQPSEPPATHSWPWDGGWGSWVFDFPALPASGRRAGPTIRRSAPTLRRIGRRRQTRRRLVRRRRSRCGRATSAGRAANGCRRTLQSERANGEDSSLRDLRSAQPVTLGLQLTVANSETPSEPPQANTRQAPVLPTTAAAEKRLRGPPASSGPGRQAPLSGQWLASSSFASSAAAASSGPEESDKATAAAAATTAVANCCCSQSITAEPSEKSPRVATASPYSFAPPEPVTVFRSASPLSLKSVSLSDESESEVRRCRSRQSSIRRCRVPANQSHSRSPIAAELAVSVEPTASCRVQLGQSQRLHRAGIRQAAGVDKVQRMAKRIRREMTRRMKCGDAAARTHLCARKRRP
uniref:Protein kinase domain-containing protein n=1 Tax=Macrostomum lignano TaxID=282301 RepID=A0A1I8JKM5_9PLAT